MTMPASAGSTWLLALSSIVRQARNSRRYRAGMEIEEIGCERQRPASDMACSHSLRLSGRALGVPAVVAPSMLNLGEAILLGAQVL